MIALILIKLLIAIVFTGFIRRGAFLSGGVNLLLIIDLLCIALVYFFFEYLCIYDIIFYILNLLFKIILLIFKPLWIAIKWFVSVIF